jgi:hypothetical protein
LHIELQLEYKGCSSMAKMNPRPVQRREIPDPPEVDARVGNRLIEVKFGVDALRTIRTSLMQLAYAVAQAPAFKGVLVLVDSTITEKRLRDEWQAARGVLRPEIMNRVTVCLAQDGGYAGIPRDPDAETRRVLDEVVRQELPQAVSRLTRTDFSFVILKLLIHHWLGNGEPVTADWLARSAGCSYPTVASALRRLGGLIERRSDRRIALRWFPKEEFARLLAVSDRARATARFADQSGQPRSPDTHLRRLEKLKPHGLAIGGVLGARHFYPGLDLVGIPRLDLSQHCPGKRVDLGFIDKLDPALKRVHDPLQPATVAVHIVRHADPFFESRKGGLHWADPVECLLDLHEMRLESQAADFLRELQSRRSSLT